MLLRRDFLTTAGLWAAAQSRAQVRKPNLILLVAGGLRAPQLDAEIRMPNLERLAREGTRFDRVYVSCPSAGPSQASLVNGQFPFAAGVLKDGDRLAAGQPTLAMQLRAAGYQTGFFGDWRLGGAPTDHGFAAWSRSIRNVGEFLKSANKPFFGMLGWSRGEGIRLAEYEAECATVDGDTGSLLAMLSGQHLAEDTVAAFTSSHGSMLGSHGLDGADVPFEEAVRVPLVLRYPGHVAPGRRYDGLASNVDLAPTLLALCGAPPLDVAQGHDLMVQQAESVYSVGKLGTPDQWRMVVRGADKLVIDREQNVTHLYNLAQDPFEMDNRAQDPAQDLKRDELKALLKDWMRRTGDGMDPSGLKRRGPAVKPAEPSLREPR